METTERIPVADIHWTGVVVSKGSRTLYRELPDSDTAHPTVGPWWYGEKVEDGELVGAYHFRTRREGKEWVNRNPDPDPLEIMVPSREDTSIHEAICQRFEAYGEMEGIDVTHQYGDRLSRLMDLATVAETMNMDWEGLLSADATNFIHDVMGIHRHMDRPVGELGDCFVPRFARSES